MPGTARVGAFTHSKGSQDVKRLSLPAVAAGTAGIVAIGVAAATAVPMGFTQDRSAELAQQINPAKPKSVILIIGDGMDDSMITAARNYSLGAGGRFNLDSLPFTGAMTTYGLKTDPAKDYPIAYVSDSAPTASGWSTGKKTVDGRVSQGPSVDDVTPGDNYETVLEEFKKAGKLTGNVSTAEITDATPAAAASHINARGCQGPANMSACPAELKSVGGLGSISEQLVDNKIDVILGGGRGRFTQGTALQDGSPNVLTYATTKKGYRSVGTAAELNAVTDLSGGPVLGLFSGGNMTPKYQPLVATPPPPAGSPDPVAQRCQAADRGTQPSLSVMTKKAIDLLDNPKGFFLQTESAMVDKQEHAADICGAIGDVEELDATVKVALDYQKANPDTLVIVTGDHSHSTQIVGGIDQGRQTATVLTADGDPMTVAYSTSGSGSNHTGAQIRVAAIGPQAANVTGVIDQTDLYGTMMGRTPSTLPSAPTTTVTVTPKPTPTPTATPPAPTTPPATKPSIWLAAPKKVARSAQTWISVTVDGATEVKVRIKQRKNTSVKTLKDEGGSLRLPGSLRKGAVKVKVIATGDGGRSTLTRTIVVR